MALHGVVIDRADRVELPTAEWLVAGGALVVVVMVNGRVSDGFCCLDAGGLGYCVATEASGGARVFEVMAVQAYLDRRCVGRIPCAPIE